MVATGYRKLFNDKVKLDAMLLLRRQGWSINSLAIMFHCHKKTIQEQCRKSGIKPQRGGFSLKRDLNPVFALLNIQREWKEIDGERINLGHTYEFYLNKSRDVRL